MATIAAYHARSFEGLPEEFRVYHSNSNCFVVAEDDRVDGDGGRPPCKLCSEWNKRDLSEVSSSLTTVPLTGDLLGEATAAAKPKPDDGAA
jgi:hypothetical protein